MIATLADVITWLEDAGRSQRDKLAGLRASAGAIRALHDDDHERALREIRRRLRAPKLAGEVQELLEQLAERPPNPRPPGAAPPGAGAPTDEAEALEAAITADPDAPGPYAVLADLLQERGHPLGALIAIGQELLRRPGSAAVRAAHRSHLAAHRERLLGPLGDCEDALLDVDWYMGFIRGCRIAARRAYGEPPLDLGLVARWLLDRPGPGRFLQRLTVGIGPRDGDAYARVCAALARRPRPTLRVLALGDYQSEGFEVPPASAADVWPAAPGLRELVVRHPELAVGVPRLPALERLWLRTWAGELRALSDGAELPALEHLALELVVPMRGYGEPGDLDISAVAAALSALRAPRLRSLALVSHGRGDALCQVIAETALPPRLERLDLGDSLVTDAGAAVLHDHRAALRHLRLCVGEHELGPAGRARLEAAVAELALGGPAYAIPGLAL